MEPQILPSVWGLIALFYLTGLHNHRLLLNSVASDLLLYRIIQVLRFGGEAGHQVVGIEFDSSEL